VRSVAIGSLICLVAGFEIYRVSQPETRLLFADRRYFLADREAVLKRLENESGKQLVMVKYGPRHSVHEEFVFNDADIDSSRIVWARAMSGGKDAELLAYYPNRRAWLLESNGTITLRPYNGSPAETVTIRTH
jgi:hypothetical protein